MKTEAATQIGSTTGTTAMSLAYQTSGPGFRAIESNIEKAKLSPKIQDLLETSDRDADGRALPDTALTDSSANLPRSIIHSENGKILDWTG